MERGFDDWNYGIRAEDDLSRMAEDLAELESIRRELVAQGYSAVDVIKMTGGFADDG